MDAINGAKIYKIIRECRICGSKSLTDILDLGHQHLTGVFPLPEEEVPSSPLVVCKCDHCHLVQLKYTVDLSLMYGETYGYQSSLNSSMVRHLEGIANKVKSLVELTDQDIVLDIGSNDATFLKFFDSTKYTLVGIDPTAVRFLDEYGEQDDGGRIHVVTDFFSKQAYDSILKDRKAKLVTSIACFYDLENPIEFARETAEILAEDGIWFMEMAYLPSIIRNLCFDGYVQEHLEYYSLKDIKYIFDQVGLKIIDVELTDTNGGSFMVTAAHNANSHYEEYWRLKSLLLEESHLSWLDSHLTFEADVKSFKSKFRALLQELRDQGQTVYGLGASTKFNVVLQYCGIGTDLLPAIGEVNDYKFGRVTPGSRIPIVPEREILSKNPDFLVIGPYHFRDAFIRNLNSYIEAGGSIIFPLPKLEIYSKKIRIPAHLPHDALGIIGAVA